MSTSREDLVYASVKQILINVLGLHGTDHDLQRETPLLGNFPEFDSMSVITLITALEEQFGIAIDDDDIHGGTFETVGGLAAFVESKLAGR